MLNSLFHGSVGFHSGVRVSAGFIAGLLMLSLLMKPRYPQNTKKAASILNNYPLRRPLRYYDFCVSYLLSSFISLMLTGAAERQLSSLARTTLVRSWMDPVLLANVVIPCALITVYSHFLHAGCLERSGCYRHCRSLWILFWDTYEAPLVLEILQITDDVVIHRDWFIGTCSWVNGR